MPFIGGALLASWLVVQCYPARPSSSKCPPLPAISHQGQARALPTCPCSPVSQSCPAATSQGKEDSRENRKGFNTTLEQQTYMLKEPPTPTEPLPTTLNNSSFAWANHHTLIITPVTRDRTWTSTLLYLISFIIPEETEIGHSSPSCNKKNLKGGVFRRVCKTASWETKTVVWR